MARDDAVTLVTGAGFGVTAPESVVVALCADPPTPDRVRVDMLPSLAIEVAQLGEALAATITEGVPGLAGGGGMTAAGSRTVAMLALSSDRIRTVATSRPAAVSVSTKPAPRAHSYGHARISWPDGTVRGGWLQVGNAQDFTATVPAEVANRLLAGEGRPGASTPAAMFGPGLVTSCGGSYLPG